jgi:hypothetical protein
MAEDEDVEAFILCGECAVDGERRAAELCQPAEIAVGRAGAAQLDLRAGRGDLVEVGRQALEVRRVSRPIDEALPKDAHRAPLLSGGSGATA